MKIDLHTHTNFSDGLLSPEELLAFVAKFNYRYLSITDHDNINGYLSAQKIASKYEIEIIPGVEISTEYLDSDIHILAYYYDPQNKPFIDMLNYIYSKRYNRGQQIFAKLQQLGVNLKWERILEISGHNQYIGRPHLARAMVEAGYVPNIRDAFDRYLGNDGPAFIPKVSFDTAEAIEIIKQAGGIPVLAHPGKLDCNAYVYDVIDMGIMGLEVFYLTHTAKQIENYSELALKNGIIRTGGTDFHGEEYAINEYGNFSVPEMCLRELKNARR